MSRFGHFIKVVVNSFRTPGLILSDSIVNIDNVYILVPPLFRCSKLPVI